MRHTVRALSATVFAAAMTAALVAPASAKVSPPTANPHSIKTSPYVAMGDSYAAGAGVSPFVPGAPATCSRSQLNFAHDIAAQTTPASFTDVTCSGAKTSDLFTSQAPGVAPQLDALNQHARLVTMTIGGNDENVFGDSIRSCVGIALATKNFAGNPCQSTFGSTFTDKVINQTYPNLVTALTAVKKKAPAATVVILGYPSILPSVGNPACLASMPIAMGDVPYLDNLEATLNSVARKAAQQTGARFIDMAPSSAGHDACQAPGTRWIEPLVNPVNADPVHPNATGEAAMADQTLAQLGL